MLMFQSFDQDATTYRETIRTTFGVGSGDSLRGLMGRHRWNGRFISGAIRLRTECISFQEHLVDTIVQTKCMVASVEAVVAGLLQSAGLHGAVAIL